MSDRRMTSRLGGGCGFLLFACAMTCTMLLVNGTLVSLAYPALAAVCDRVASYMPGLISGSRLSQILLLALPVALIFAEWWLIDFVADHFTGRRNSATDDRRGSS